MPIQKSMYIRDLPVPTGNTIHFGEGEVPPGAVKVNSEEVLHMSLKMVNAWRPRRDVWTFTYGASVNGVITVIAGAVYASFFRKTFKLFDYKRQVTIAGSVVFPSVMSVLFHHKFVQHPILARNYDCAPCLQARAAAIQFAVTTIQTPIFSFFICGAMAHAAFRYSLPPLTDPVAWLVRAFKMVRPVFPNMLKFGGVAAAYAALLAHKQMLAAEKVHERLMQGPIGPHLWNEAESDNTE